MNAAQIAPGTGADPTRQLSGRELLQQAIVGLSTQSWLASMVIHLVILIVLALALGTAKVVQVLTEPRFEAAEVLDIPVTILTPIDFHATPDEPTVLDTESLTDPPPATDLFDSRTFGSSPVEPGGSGENLPGLMGPPIAFPTVALGPGPGGGQRFNLGTGGTGEGPPIARSFGLRSDKRRDGATKPSERAVAAALSWIARHQNPGGSWSINHAPRCKSGFCSGAGNAETEAGATALALLPFLAAGQTHESKGPYRQNISGGINYLLKNQKPSGDLSGGPHQMYAHGLATIALCEAYGMTEDSRIRTAAQAALRFIESGQNRQGSWRYTHGSDDSDTSVFAWQVMALKSGQMAGLEVRPDALGGSRNYLQLIGRGSYRSEFSYTPGGSSTQTMTAAGLLASQYLGAKRSDPVIVGGIDYLGQRLPRIEERNTYYWYYATQVMHNVPGPEWDAWNRRTRRILIDTQEREGCAAGSWDPAKPTDDSWGSAGGRLMVTSLSALTLEVYYRYLPLYQLDEKGQEP